MKTWIRWSVAAIASVTTFAIVMIHKQSTDFQFFFAMSAMCTPWFCAVIVILEDALLWVGGWLASHTFMSAIKEILGYLLLAVGAVVLGFLAIGDVIITLLKIFSSE